MAVETTPGKPANEAGVYRHLPTGKELIVLPDGSSTAQGDALVRMGFTRIADAPSRKELAAMQAEQLKADLASGVHDSIEAYPTPGTQDVVFNGSVTDVGGVGDALAVKDKEIGSLKAQLLHATAPLEEVPSEETQTNEEENK